MTEKLTAEQMEQMADALLQEDTAKKTAPVITKNAASWTKRPSPRCPPPL